MTDLHAVCRLIFSLLVVLFNFHQQVVASDASYEQQIIVESPIDQQARIGDQALLKCKVRNLRGEPQWCIDDFCLGVNKKDAAGAAMGQNETTRLDVSSGATTTSGLHLKGRPRYRIVGDRAKGEFNLLIEPVQLQDNMYFYCMVTAASETIKAVKSKKVFLTVLSK
jgi:hypothetical protein